jgi:hypothetical protein
MTLHRAILEFLIVAALINAAAWCASAVLPPIF